MFKWFRHENQVERWLRQKGENDERKFELFSLLRQAAPSQVAWIGGRIIVFPGEGIIF